MTPIRKNQVRVMEEKEEVRVEVDEVHEVDEVDEVDNCADCIRFTNEEYDAFLLTLPLFRRTFTRTCIRCLHEGQLSRVDFVRHHVCGERINDLTGLCRDCLDEIGYI